eukprot:TRINITY_DN5512_c0_g2_i1.p1 TRINITY_DN5512_c0_g2~~TRINITY_DN5512_c0_g2_i1.p1  ORF type:complete len:153 (+),score=18.81 TRINITY_DN5512_c0_g2_i1:275-733(+)
MPFNDDTADTMIAPPHEGGPVDHLGPHTPSTSAPPSTSRDMSHVPSDKLREFKQNDLGDLEDNETRVVEWSWACGNGDQYISFDARESGIIEEAFLQGRPRLELEIKPISRAGTPAKPIVYEMPSLCSLSLSLSLTAHLHTSLTTSTLHHYH